MNCEHGRKKVSASIIHTYILYYIFHLVARIVPSILNASRMSVIAVVYGFKIEFDSHRLT